MSIYENNFACSDTVLDNLNAWTIISWDGTWQMQWIFYTEKVALMVTLLTLILEAPSLGQD